MLCRKFSLPLSRRYWLARDHLTTAWRQESPHGHCFRFDQHLLEAFLEQAGFSDIHAFAYKSGIDLNFLLDSEDRWVESFAIEAKRPAF